MPETSPANRAKAALRYLLDAWALTDLEPGARILSKDEALQLLDLVITQNRGGPDVKFEEREGLRWFAEHVHERFDWDDLVSLGLSREPSFSILLRKHIDELHTENNQAWCTEGLCGWEEALTNE